MHGTSTASPPLRIETGQGDERPVRWHVAHPAFTKRQLQLELQLQIIPGGASSGGSRITPKAPSRSTSPPSPSRQTACIATTR